MKTCTLAFLCSWFWCSNLAIAEDSAMEHLVQALLNSGDRTILTGEFHYTLKVLEETPTPEMVAAQVEGIQAQLKEQLKKHKENPDMMSRIQKAIDTAPEYIPPQVLDNAKLQFRMYFALDGPELGGDRYLEMAQFDRDTNAYRDPRFLLLRSRGDSQGTSIDREPLQPGMVIVGKGRQTAYLPSQEPHRLGRIHGTLCSMTAGMTAPQIKETLLKQVTNLNVGQVLNESGIETKKLEFQLRLELPQKFIDKYPAESAAAGFNTVVLHIVPGRGYITPLIQEFDVNGSLILEYVNGDYFQTNNPDIWFPSTCDYRHDVMRNNKLHQEQYKFAKDSVVLNRKIADRRFTISVPSGTVVLDARDGKNTNYQVSSDLSLSIDDADHLSQVEGLGLAPDPVPQGKNRIAPKQGWNIYLIIANIVVLILVGIVGWKKGTGSSSKTETSQ